MSQVCWGRGASWEGQNKKENNFFYHLQKISEQWYNWKGENLHDRPSIFNWQFVKKNIQWHCLMIYCCHPSLHSYSLRPTSNVHRDTEIDGTLCFTRKDLFGIYLHAGGFSLYSLIHHNFNSQVHWIRTHTQCSLLFTQILSPLSSSLFMAQPVIAIYWKSLEEVKKKLNTCWLWVWVE